MKEDDHNTIIEPFNIEQIDCNKFVETKCPIELRNKYVGVNCKSYAGCYVREFEKEGENDNIPIFMFISSIFYSIVFYILLLGAILAFPSIDLIIYAIIIYFYTTFFQTRIYLSVKKIHSYSEFKHHLKKLLNCDVEIWLSPSENTIKFPSNYVTDISGIINLPKNIKYVCFGKVQIFSDKELEDIEEKLHYANIKIKLTYENEELKIPVNHIFTLGSINENLFKSILKTILSLLLLQWVYNIFYYISTKGKKSEMVVIKISKLAIKNQDLSLSPTKLIIHGKELDINIKTIFSEKNPNYDQNIKKLNKDYDEYLKKKKEEEEKWEKVKQERIKEKKEEIKKEKELEKERKRRKEEIRANTTILSTLNNRHFEIEVKKIFDKVTLFLTVYRRNEDEKFKINLGYYDENAVETIKNKEGNCIIFYPNGYNVKVEIQFYPYYFTINIGTEFFERFNLD